LKLLTAVDVMNVFVACLIEKSLITVASYIPKLLSTSTRIQENISATNNLKVLSVIFQY